MNQRACLLADSFVYGQHDDLCAGTNRRARTSMTIVARAVNWASRSQRTSAAHFTEAGQRLRYITSGDPGGSSTQDFAAWAWGRYDPRPAQGVDVSDRCIVAGSHTCRVAVRFLRVGGRTTNAIRNSLVLAGIQLAVPASTHEFTAVTPTGTVTRQCTCRDSLRVGHGDLRSDRDSFSLRRHHQHPLYGVRSEHE